MDNQKSRRYQKKYLKVIAMDPDLHPYKKRHLIAHASAHHLFHQKERQTTSLMTWMTLQTGQELGKRKER